MKFKIPVEGGDDEINMAPMIDMVFLLLIFFMVASHLTALERVEVKLPVAESSKVPEEAPGRQIISLKPALDNGVDIYMNLSTVKPEQLVDMLVKARLENEDLRVYLRADRNVQHKHVKAVMDACVAAEILNVIFGTFESGD